MRRSVCFACTAYLLSVSAAAQKPPAAGQTGPQNATPPPDPTAPAGRPRAAEAGARGANADPLAAPDPEQEEDEDDAPPPVPPAEDTLGGHFSAAAGASLLVPFGRLDSATSVPRLLDPSLGVSLDLGLGISRTTVLGLWGQYSPLSTDERCAGCSASTLAGGILVQYHLVQGLSFDPWMGAGAGLRVFRIDATEATTYVGVDWLRLRVGGDWYAFSNVGFGPFAELDLGAILSKSEGQIEGERVYGTFLLGARIVLDVPGK